MDSWEKLQQLRRLSIVMVMMDLGMAFSYRPRMVTDPLDVDELEVLRE